jgi:hypothetical protein
MTPSTEPDPLKELEAENARLVALLEAHGIAWHQASAAQAPVLTPSEPSRLSTAEKLAFCDHALMCMTAKHGCSVAVSWPANGPRW